MVVFRVKAVEVAGLAAPLAYPPKGDFAKATQLLNNLGNAPSLSEINL